MADRASPGLSERGEERQMPSRLEVKEVRDSVILKHQGILCGHGDSPYLQQGLISVMIAREALKLGYQVGDTVQYAIILPLKRGSS